VRTASALVLALLLAGCGGGEDDARMRAGRAVFTDLARPRCTLCHTLRDAGATAQVGPDLDRLKPDSARVAAAVTNGVGVMPAQGDNLTPEQIQAVAAYVANVAGTR
jgi:cytochrome c6